MKKILDLGNITNNLLAGFNLQNSAIDLTFKTGTLNSEKGLTQFIRYSNGKMEMSITIDKDWINSSNFVELANTIIHECFHAYIYGKIYDINGSHSNILPEPDFDKDFKEYQRLYGGNNAQHNYMAYEYLKFMKKALSDYFNDNANTDSRDKFLNYVSDMSAWKGTDKLFESLAWSGLKTTQAWKDLGSDTTAIKEYNATFSSLLSKDKPCK